MTTTGPAGRRPLTPAEIDMAKKRDGGPFYGRKVQREAVQIHAKPEKRSFGGQPAWVWWASGGDNWGVDLSKGVLPFDLASRLDLATFPTPPGSGGRWYATEEDAEAALRYGLRVTEGQDSF